MSHPESEGMTLIFYFSQSLLKVFMLCLPECCKWPEPPVDGNKHTWQVKHPKVMQKFPKPENKVPASCQEPDATCLHDGAIYKTQQQFYLACFLTVSSTPQLVPFMQCLAFSQLKSVCIISNLATSEVHYRGGKSVSIQQLLCLPQKVKQVE